MTKKALYMALLLVLVACEDQYETTHKFVKQYYLSKGYPIYLDASEILVDIQVKPSITPDAAFKIVSNDNYFFVGEKMKGIHVYKKTNANQASPLCFIECTHMKAFDVTDNMLYCNNFVDLLAIDVENPLQAKIKYREKDYFNNYYNTNYNIPIYYEAGANFYTLGYRQIILTGIETDTDPPPDFLEYDKLYGNGIVVKEIPDTLQSDKPYTGITNAEGNLLTFGSSSLVHCLYDSGSLNITMWSVDNYIDVFIQNSNLQYKDGIVYIIGRSNFTLFYYPTGLSAFQNFLFLFNDFVDLVSVSEPANSFVAISGDRRIDAVIANTKFGNSSRDSYGATSLINVNNTILALGNQLTLYNLNYQNNIGMIEQKKQYTNISGTSMLRDGDVLIVANQQGLIFYDISNLENITLLP